MKCYTDGSRLMLSLIGRGNSIRDEDLVAPPWVWRKDGTRRHFYETYRTSIGDSRVKSFRIWDIEKTERLRWKLYQRERDAFRAWQQAYYAVKQAGRSSCKHEDGICVCQVSGRGEQEGITINVKNRNTKLVNPEVAQEFLKADRQHAKWIRYLRLAEYVLVMGLRRAFPQLDKRLAADKLVRVQVNGRDYLFLGYRGEYLKVFRYAEECPAIEEWTSDYSSLLKEAIDSKPPDRYLLTYEVQCE